MGDQRSRTLAAVACAVLVAAAFGAQDLILDSIRPGKSTSADFRARLGEPVRAETAGDLKAERFDPKDNLLKEIACWFDSRGVLQWARVRPLHKIGPEDAALLFTSRGASEVTQGNAFSEQGAAQGQTWLHRASGIHWVVLNNAVEEMWFTLPNADPAQIRARIKGPEQASLGAPSPAPPVPAAAPRPQTQSQPQPAPTASAVPLPPPARDPLLDIRPAVQGSQGPSFLGLEVGRSTQADADAVLGAPTKSGISTEGKKVTTHNGSKVGLREVVVRYAAGDVIEGMVLVPTQPASPAELAWTLGLGKPDRAVPSGAAQFLCFDTAGIRFSQEGKVVGAVALIPSQPAAPPAGASGRQPPGPGSVDAVARGRELVGQQKYAEAIEHFKSALQISPKESYQGLGICYYHLGDYESADRNIVQAYRRDLNDPVSIFYTGATRDIRKKTHEAIDLYKAFLKLGYRNESMNAFARSRLDALQSSSPKPSETLQNLIDAVFKQTRP
jgi:tetratricopeptide (TPR) repeat protein